MVTQYPAKIDTAITLPKAIDNVTPVSSKVYNDLRDAVIALEEELGVKPSGIYGTVRARLDFLEAHGGGGGGSQTLSQVLALGNTTGGNNIVLSSGDAISGSPINMNGDTVINGKLQLSQQSTTPTPAPTNAGTVWVRNNTHQTLMFSTNDGYDLAATWTYPSTQTITANHTAINGERTWYDPSGGTFTLTAPPSPAMGHKWAIKNVTTNATSITVSGNGNNIEDPIAVSLVSSFTFTAPLGSITWEFDGIRWLVV